MVIQLKAVGLKEQTRAAHRKEIERHIQFRTA